MSITFTKKISDELYIDSFDLNKELTLEYVGVNALYVLVDKTFGDFHGFIDDPEDPYNTELYKVITVNANKTPDVAYYLTDIHVPERIFEDEVLVDGSIYKQISNPTLRDYYNIRYNLETNEWEWILVTRHPASLLNITAEKYKEFVESNLDSIKNDTKLTALANSYIKSLNDFNTSGKGSIPSWKIIEAKVSDVPMVPFQLLSAFNALI